MMQLSCCGAMRRTSSPPQVRNRSDSQRVVYDKLYFTAVNILSGSAMHTKYPSFLRIIKPFGLRCFHRLFQVFAVLFEF